jgi:hypothetical protein
MKFVRFALQFGTVIALLGAAQVLADDRVNWTSVQEILPGPKPGHWTLSPVDLLPWKSQAAREGGLSQIGFGDERAWKLQAQRATVVALELPLAVGCGRGPRGFVVGVLDANGKLLARSAELFSQGSDADVNNKPYRVDTAPYRISNTETAFGVRIVHYHPEKHWCYADQVLHLFRVVGKDVVRILTTDAFYEQFDQIDLAEQDTEEALNQMVNDPECSFSYEKPFPPKGQGSVFRMLPSQNKGFYDIQRTQKGGPTATFRWDGQRYVMDGKDPIDHHVRDEWDWCTGRRYLKDHDLPLPAPSKADIKPSAAPAPNPSKH